MAREKKRQTVSPYLAGLANPKTGINGRLAKARGQVAGFGDNPAVCPEF